MSSKFFSLLLLGLATAWHAPATTLVWTNTAGGHWNATNNWSPNQMPGAADTVLITNDGTYTVTINVKTLSVASLTLGGASGTQTLRSYAMSSGDTGAALTLGNGVIGNHGVLSMVGGTYLTLLQGGVVVGSGGTLSLDNTRLNNATVEVQAGGTLTTAGPASSLYSGSRLAVKTNGVVNLTVNFSLYGPATNAGTINVLGGQVTLQNAGTPNFAGGLVNEAGGMVNFLTGSAGMTGSGQAYLTNRGTITASDAGGTTINVARLDNSLGTMHCTAGRLVLGQFNGDGNLDGIYQADAGAEIQFDATDTPGTSAGASLQCLGAGRLDFSTGTLTLAADQLPPNLVFGGNTGTTLVLGADITHPLSMDYGNLTRASGVVIGSGGILTANSDVRLDVPIEVRAAGRLDIVGSLHINPTSSLTVKTGAVVNLDGVLNVWGPMVNAGTVNFVSGSISIQNGVAGRVGGLINERGGIIAHYGKGGNIQGLGGADYLINRGTMIRTTNASTATSIIQMTTFTNEGTLSAQKGRIQINKSLSLPASSILNVGLNGPGDFGKIQWGLSGDGTLPLAGTFTLTLNNGYVPAVGASFTVMECSGYADLRFSGSFASVDAPGFSTTYSNKSVTLTYMGLAPIPVFEVSPLQIACRTFRVRGSASDPDGNGTITNFTLLLDTNILVSAANRQAQTTVCYDFPGDVTFTARATDNRGLTGSTNLTISIVPLSPRVLDPIGFQTNGAFKLCMGDAEGTNYLALANADLNTTNWVVLGPMDNTNGLWRYLDLTATNAAQRYYRAQQLP